MKNLVQNLLIIIFLVPISTLANESTLELSYPKNNSLLRNTNINFVMNVKAENIDEIKIFTPLEEIKIKPNDKKSIYCKNIALKLGENTISIRSYKTNEIIDQDVIKVYVSAEIYKQYKFPPKVYKQNFFHSNSNEKECKECHDMSVNEIKDTAFLDVKESNCYGCHSNITNEKYAHAPAVNWLCTSCHNGKVGSDNKKNDGLSKYIAPEPVNIECFRCHEKKLKLWGSNKYKHEPLDSGHCNKCHNPHSSPYEMFIRKPVNNICLGCHKDKHINAIDFRKTKCKVIDNATNCIECHSPHASSRRFFLKDK